MALRQRAYGGPADLPAIFELLVAGIDAGYVDLELRSTSLRITLANPSFDAGRLTLLLEDDDRLLAFAILWRGRYLGSLVHPEARGTLERQVLAWALSAAGPEPLWALARSDDALMRGIFEAEGFTLADEELRMSRSLDAPVEEPIVPPGFTIRPLAGLPELPGWIALNERAFGTPSAAVRTRAETIADADYDPALDLVAVDSAGTLAAMCTCAIARYEAEHCRERVTKFGPIAVDPRYRRLGLGRAIVLAGLRLARERGMDLATLDTDMDNEPAHRLYESVGFRAAYTACWFAAPTQDS